MGCFHHVYSFSVVSGLECSTMGPRQDALAGL